jgi:hypothetical protein
MGHPNVSVQDAPRAPKDGEVGFGKSSQLGSQMVTKSGGGGIAPDSYAANNAVLEYRRYTL